MKILSKGTYYGNMQLELDSKGILLSEYEYHMPKTDWHYHENPYFMYVLEGNVLDVNKKQKTNCPPGTFLLHNWNEQHYNTRESIGARGFHIEFERSWFEDKKLNIDLWEGSQRINNPYLHHILAKIYFEFKCQDIFSEISIDLLLLQLCETTQRIQDSSFEKKPSWVSTLEQLLHEETDPITLDMLSAQLGVHPAHLSRAIPKYFNATLGDYMRQQKIKKALGFIFNLDFSLTEISYICGFADQSHFTRTFKRYFNRTPNDFRKRLTAC